MTEYSTAYGKNPLMFGTADYAAALLPHHYNPEKLQSTRESVLSWLTGAGSKYLDPQNQPGGTNELGQPGLYDRLQTPTINPMWGDASRPDKNKFFGAADLDASIAGGFSKLQIKDYLDDNLDQLQGKNVPGGGGLYDWLSDSSTPSPHLDRPKSPYDWGTIGGMSGQDLSINPGKSLVSSKALGTVESTTGKRSKVRKTKDLNRKTRSLTISSY